MLNVTRFTRLVIIFSMAMALASCKKDSESAPNLWRSKTWKRGLIDKNPSTNPPGANVYYAVVDCEKDDTFKFGSDGKLEWFRNNDHCGINETPMVTQTYTFNRKTKELFIDSDKYSDTYIVVEETNSQIKFYIPITRANGVENMIFLLQ
ncbi:hypothetical protein [Adhaeribacter arboris]|nr:hypothetical protein [Adhaeribacter arboris]